MRRASVTDAKGKNPFPGRRHVLWLEEYEPSSESKIRRFVMVFGVGRILMYKR